MIIYMLSLYYAGNPNSVKFSCKDFSSSLLAENVTPSNFSSHLSPLGEASKKSGVCCKVAFYFLFSFNGRLLISIFFLFILSIKREENHDNKLLLLIFE